MNLWRYLCDHAKGMAKGERFYRQSVDAGKVVAPVVLPAVQAVLTANNLPATPQGALSLLVVKAASALDPLPADDANALRAFVKSALPPIPPGGSPQ